MKYEMIERNLELLNLELEDVQIWRLVRKTMFSLCQALKLKAKLVRSHDGYSSITVSPWLRYSRIWYTVTQFLTNGLNIISVGDGRGKQVDGINYDIYSDPILELDDFDNLHLERLWKLEHPNPAATHPMRYFRFNYA